MSILTKRVNEMNVGKFEGGDMQNVIGTVPVALAVLAISSIVSTEPF